MCDSDWDKAMAGQEHWEKVTEYKKIRKKEKMYASIEKKIYINMYILGCYLVEKLLPKHRNYTRNEN